MTPPAFFFSILALKVNFAVLSHGYYTKTIVSRLSIYLLMCTVHCIPAFVHTDEGQMDGNIFRIAKQTISRVD